MADEYCDNYEHAANNLIMNDEEWVPNYSSGSTTNILQNKKAEAKRMINYVAFQMYDQVSLDIMINTRIT